MQRFKRSGALCALLMATFAGNAAAAEIIGDFTDPTRAPHWAMTSELTWLASPGTERAPPTMDGSGWLNMMAFGRSDQIAYATSSVPLDTRLPIRISYEFVSYSTRNINGAISGFHLIDPAKGPELHKQGKAFDCASSTLMVSFGHESRYYSACGGPYDFWNQFNRVVVRAENTVIARYEAPLWLTCGNYDYWGGTRAPDRDCASREEAVALGFVRTVDALVTPDPLGAGYTLDVDIDGQPLYSQLAVAQPLPPTVLFGLWGDHDGRPHHAVRNVHVTQDALLVSAVNGRCLDVQYGVAVNHQLIAYPCHGQANQVLRFANEVIQVGGLCLDAEYGRNQDGTRVISYPCHGNPNQRWELTQGGQLRSKMAGTQRCVTLERGGRSVSLQPCDSRLVAQRFSVLSP
jgi:hypothetical protein